MTTRNLGQVQALWISTVAPTNTAMIWYDTNTGVNSHKYYDVSTSTWEAFILNAATAPLLRSGATILLVYDATQFEVVAGALTIKSDILASVTPPFPMSDIIGLTAALATKVDKISGYSLLVDTEIARLLTLSNYTLPSSLPATIITQTTSYNFVTQAQIDAWNAKQDSLGYTPYDAANPADYITMSDISGLNFLNSYIITLPAAALVADRVAGSVPGTDYNADWTIEASGDNPNDLLIIHNLGRRIFGVKIHSVVGTEETELMRNEAYSGIVTPDQNNLLIKNLATIGLPIVINLVFS